MLFLPVIPHVGIGPLKLGMSPEQILVTINQLRYQWTRPDKSKILITQDNGEDVLLRYMDHDSFFMVRYKDDQAIEINIHKQLKELANITLFDINVFETPVEQLVADLKQFSAYTYDSDDEDLSTEYIFQDIGVRLWREHPFHKKLFLDKAYMKEMKLVIDDMFQYLYFEMVGVM